MLSNKQVQTPSGPKTTGLLLTLYVHHRLDENFVPTSLSPGARLTLKSLSGMLRLAMAEGRLTEGLGLTSARNILASK